MRRCIHLARLGEGNVSPNPLVGAVIVHDNQIIGEGFHEQYGGPHAEVNAISSVKDPSKLNSSVLYVNLEPCSHFGKTPPCADLIIEKGIPVVVIGMSDPFEAVNGNGIRKLTDAGIEVHCQILEDECKKLNKRFITLQQQQRPYITLKWAMTANGIAGIKDQPVRISNEATRIHAHHLRHSEQAILVGANTVICDNPRLNVRSWTGRDPIRIIADPKGKLHPLSQWNVFDGTQRTLLFTGRPDQHNSLIEQIELVQDLPVVIQIVRHLGKNKIDSLLVEGGTSLQQQFIDNGLWDECYIYKSEHQLPDGIPAPIIPTGEMTISPFGDNELIHIQRS